MLTPILGDLKNWSEQRARQLYLALVVTTGALALWLRALHLTDVAIRSPDETLYTNFARQISLNGLDAYRNIFEYYANTPSQWIYPSPTRVLHVLLFSGVMKVTGATSAQAGAGVSWLLGIASVLLLARFGERFFGRFVAVVAAFFLATYVVDLEFSRRAWGESTATFVTLLIVFATCALDREPTSKRRLAAFLAAGMACLFEKETTIFAYALCGVWLCARQCFVAQARTRALVFAGLGLGTIAVAFGVLTLLAGSLEHAVVGWVQVFGNGLGSNDWGAKNASGPWYQFLHLLLVMTPFTALMAVTGVAAVLVPSAASRLFADIPPSARAAASLCVLITLSLIAACAFGPNLQYLRIMAPANGTYCLLAALGVQLLLTLSRNAAQGRLHLLLAGALPLVFLAVSLRDYDLYRDVVVQPQLQDLTSRWVLDGVEKRRAPEIERSHQALEATPTNATNADYRSGLEDPLSRSVRLCLGAKYVDCVNAAHEALERNPKLPEAWNNAAAGYAGLMLWDDAIRSANQALALRSDFQLARNNLAWATNEKAKMALNAP